MNVAQIIAQMRRKAKVNTTQYSDADALIDLNTGKDEFWSIINSTTDESFNWERWTSDTASGQGEYSIPHVAYNEAGAKVMSEVEVVYDSSTFDGTGSLQYIKAKRVSPSSLANSWEWYEENQPASSPLFFVGDNSVFIAPIPQGDQAGTGRIRMTGVRKIADYTLSTSEADIKLPIDQQQALVYMLIVSALEHKGVDSNEINNAENRWLRKRREAIATLESRTS